MDVGHNSLDPSLKLSKSALCQKAFARGCETLGINAPCHGAAHSWEATYQEVNRLCGTAPQATVSIKADFVWNCINPLRGDVIPHAISYREFAVLCAILSKVGDKPLESCSWQEIQRRALGYATEKELKEKVLSRTDQTMPMSRQQIRSTLDDLTRNKFFARHAVGNGSRTWLTYYSFKMDERKLEVEAMALWMMRRRRGRLKRTKDKWERSGKLWQMRHQHSDPAKPKNGNPTT